jgi:anti-sigma B factor antagonist
MIPPVLSTDDDLMRITSNGFDNLTVSGEVDTLTAPHLAEALHQALAAGWDPIVLDLTDVSFFDAAGVHAVATAQRAASLAGRCMHIRADRPAVLRPLQISGLLAAADHRSPCPRHAA